MKRITAGHFECASIKATHYRYTLISKGNRGWNRQPSPRVRRCGNVTPPFPNRTVQFKSVTMGSSPLLLADDWGGDVAQRCQRERCALVQKGLIFMVINDVGSC